MAVSKLGKGNSDGEAEFNPPAFKVVLEAFQRDSQRVIEYESLNQ